jgi:hypothetical protein
MFAIGFILGYLAGRPKKPKEEPISDDDSTIYERKDLNKGEDWIDPNEDYIN